MIMVVTDFHLNINETEYRLIHDENESLGLLLKVVSYIQLY